MKSFLSCLISIVLLAFFKSSIAHEISHLDAHFSLHLSEGDSFSEEEISSNFNGYHSYSGFYLDENPSSYYETLEYPQYYTYFSSFYTEIDDPYSWIDDFGNKSETQSYSDNDDGHFISESEVDDGQQIQKYENSLLNYILNNTKIHYEHESIDLMFEPLQGESSKGSEKNNRTDKPETTSDQMAFRSEVSSEEIIIYDLSDESITPFTDAPRTTLFTDNPLLFRSDESNEEFEESIEDIEDGISLITDTSAEQESVEELEEFNDISDLKEEESTTLFTDAPKTTLFTNKLLLIADSEIESITPFTDAPKTTLFTDKPLLITNSEKDSRTPFTDAPKTTLITNKSMLRADSEENSITPFTDAPKTTLFTDRPVLRADSEEEKITPFTDAPKTTLFTDKPFSMADVEGESLTPFTDTPKTTLFTDKPLLRVASEEESLTPFSDAPKTTLLTDQPFLIADFEEKSLTPFTDSPKTTQFTDMPILLRSEEFEESSEGVEDSGEEFEDVTKTSSGEVSTEEMEEFDQISDWEEKSVTPFTDAPKTTLFTDKPLLFRFEESSEEFEESNEGFEELSEGVENSGEEFEDGTAISAGEDSSEEMEEVDQFSDLEEKSVTPFTDASKTTLFTDKPLLLRPEEPSEKFEVSNEEFEESSEGVEASGEEFEDGTDISAGEDSSEEIEKVDQFSDWEEKSVTPFTDAPKTTLFTDKPLLFRPEESSEEFKESNEELKESSEGVEDPGKEFEDGTEISAEEDSSEKKEEVDQISDWEEKSVTSFTDAPKTTLFTDKPLQFRPEESSEEFEESNERFEESNEGFEESSEGFEESSEGVADSGEKFEDGTENSTGEVLSEEIEEFDQTDEESVTPYTNANKTTLFTDKPMLRSDPKGKSITPFTDSPKTTLFTDKPKLFNSEEFNEEFEESHGDLRKIFNNKLVPINKTIAEEEPVEEESVTPFTNAQRTTPFTYEPTEESGKKTEHLNQIAGLVDGIIPSFTNTTETNLLTDESMVDVSEEYYEDNDDGTTEMPVQIYIM